VALADRSGWFDPVANPDASVRQDIRPQAAAVDERRQHAAAVESVEVRARLAQPVASAADRADGELPPGEAVQVDSADHDVAAVVDGAAEGLEHGRVDERQCAARTAGLERAVPAK
jgi:hypothetical protein